ncbi:MAG: glycosyltransferase family 2 protein [Clostridiales bacterium]|nr:glycosyltransferase family 2 protein [Clostridiales bacterium]
MKLITFAVPCYNSAEYMDHCIETLLTAGDEAEIILIDDGSTDGTPAIADRYAQQYPDIVRVIHQPNGGHGEGVNQGVRHAAGVYYKVVDSDDWADTDALKQVMDTLRTWVSNGTEVDLLICNYVYEHVLDNTRHVVRYTHVFPENTVFGWEDVGRWSPSEYLLMHSVFYRTQMLRDCGMELPKHTFYVDNIFVYQPLPWVKTMYYMNLDFYRYFIGRQDQSVNESVMVRRVDQQVKITKIMLDCCDVMSLRSVNHKLYQYMCRYLSMMMTISSMFLLISGTEENYQEKQELWAYLKEKDIKLYRKMRYRSLSMFSNIPGYQGRKISVGLYRIAQKIYKFN